MVTGCGVPKLILDENVYFTSLLSFFTGQTLSAGNNAYNGKKKKNSIFIINTDVIKRRKNY